ncbi:hypothetical protein C7476_104308 [Phyllobacterium bourgognense]|uniref:Uncharacterized protein n=1 Tax=Phyllobacterium bourgognense TaxID=314236 RepID=A0A368YWI3_9HYPH|nr:hypothetical protein C7476_104308 [Phyllobacterium bourgognense]
MSYPTCNVRQAAGIQDYGEFSGMLWSGHQRLLWPELTPSEPVQPGW